MTWQILYLVFAYLLGAIPNGYIIAKKLKGIDIREHGSGNTGATNVKRVVGNKAGLATLILDFLKGFIAVLGAILLFPKSTDPYQLIPVLAAFAAILGHSRSVFIGFQGGKSVITSLGAILVLEPLAAFIVAAISITIMKVTRYVSLGSIIGAVLIPIVVKLLGGPLSHQVMVLVMGLYVVYLHRSNIGRLLTRQENKL